jgi:hypothetical protein
VKSLNIAVQDRRSNPACVNASSRPAAVHPSAQQTLRRGRVEQCARARMPTNGAGHQRVRRAALVIDVSGGSAGDPK